MKVRSKSPTRWLLAIEFCLLFIAVPLALFFVRKSFGSVIIPTLLLVGGGCTAVLLFDRSFDRKALWNTRAFWRRAGKTFAIFVPAALLVGLATWALKPSLFLGFPTSAPRWWMLVLIFYPVLSVYPQELIYRTFFFHRYRPLFRKTRWLILASGVAFGLAHLFFANWIAPVMTAIGGVLFAVTYARTQSTLQASLSHGLWGDFLFTVGLGSYFYGGAIQ